MHFFHEAECGGNACGFENEFGYLEAEMQPTMGAMFFFHDYKILVIRLNRFLLPQASRRGSASVSVCRYNNVTEELVLLNFLIGPQGEAVQKWEEPSKQWVQMRHFGSPIEATRSSRVLKRRESIPKWSAIFCTRV